MQPDFKYLRTLMTASARRREGRFLAEGQHLVQEALRWGKVESVLVDSTRTDAYAAELQEAERQGIPVSVLPTSRMKSLSQTTTGQGIVAVVAYHHGHYAPDALPQEGLLCILERVQDPGNVGTILRTADALACAAVLVTPDCADVTNDKALRASMGAIYRVPVYLVPDLPQTLRDMTGEGWQIFCGDLHGTPFFDTPRAYPKQAFLVGNEGQGVTQETAALCSHRIRLPMPGHAESLNAAVAASVALYDLAREMGKL